MRIFLLEIFFWVNFKIKEPIWFFLIFYSRRQFLIFFRYSSFASTTRTSSEVSCNFVVFPAFVSVCYSVSCVSLCVRIYLKRFLINFFKQSTFHWSYLHNNIKTISWKLLCIQRFRNFTRSWKACINGCNIIHDNALLSCCNFKRGIHIKIYFNIFFCGEHSHTSLNSNFLYSYGSWRDALPSAKLYTRTQFDGDNSSSFSLSSVLTLVVRSDFFKYPSVMIHWRFLYVTKTLSSVDLE